VTVASAESAIPVIESHAPELMTEVLDPDRIETLLKNKTLLAIGPGLGTEPATVQFVRGLASKVTLPMVVDADGLNALAGSEWSGAGRLRVLTPHPGEMARLTGTKVADVQADRIGCARGYAMSHQATVVLKGHRTLLAFSDGRVWINPTGTPALAKGGTGDILTGIVSGFLVQFPQQADAAVAAAVYLHGKAGERAAADLGERSVLATDLLRYLPRAMEECAGILHQH
jgi:NAD(P)H-hydrate epimerase